MKLASLIMPESVVCGAKAADYAEAKEVLLARLRENEDLEIDPLRAALQERETLASTVVAPGVAFPHARVESLTDFHMLVGTFPDGFVAPGTDEPVRLVAMYLLSEGASNLYLKAVSAMARLLGREGMLGRLVAAKSPDAFREMAAESGVMVKDVVTAGDIMQKNPPTAGLHNTLREVADLMVKARTTHVPVVDDAGTYLGMITADRLLRVGLPNYMLDMDSVEFLNDFEPFEELLKQEQSMTADQVMDPEEPKFPAHTPMIVVAMKLAREDIECAAVLEEKRLVGMISGLDFVHKVVRA
jgi:CBS domain-containing protein/mannitol/fructose-specific phosphotransferase system IIA component (Ntr-type)